MLRVRARFVHPVTAPPIEDGAVLVDDRGTIAAVGPHPRVPTPRGARELDFPQASLVPGLVNTHTHLELTHLAGKNSERDFAAWIRTLRSLKDATTPEAFLRSAELGVRDAWAAGVTCVADTGSTGAALEALARLGGRGIYYQEVFGPDPAHCAADLARREGWPVAVHLAESLAETELVRDGAGSFADALRARGFPVTPRGCSPVEYLVQLGVVQRGTACLCIHCVQVDQRDVELLCDAGASIAHCPRSNRAHGHGTAPLAAFRRAGLRVGLGTDSVVSVGDSNLWAEAAAAGLEGADALRMLTLEGARALGLDSEIGSLDVGKAADLAVFPSAALGRPLPPSAALLTGVAGRVVHG